MLNGWLKGERIGSGTIVWKAREMMARGEIDYEGFIDLVASRRRRSAIATPWARPRR
jgi:dihydroxy-acid dehydratase